MHVFHLIETGSPEQTLREQHGCVKQPSKKKKTDSLQIFFSQNTKENSLLCVTVFVFSKQRLVHCSV